MNKEKKYKYIKKFLTLENYNKHTYYTPKWMKIFKIPKSYKTEYAGKWNEDEVFQTCVEKIWDKLCIEDNFELQSIGDLDLIKNEEWKLELISALMNQIEYMVFNNTIIDSVNMNGFETGNITKGRVHSNFWYDEPYQKLWVIGFFTGKPLQDFIDLDWTQLATRQFIRDVAKVVMENFDEQLNGFVDENANVIADKITPIVLGELTDNFNELLNKDKDFISTQTSLQTLEEDNHLVHTKLIKEGNDWTTIAGEIYADSLEEVVSNVNRKTDERVPITDKYYAGDDENLIFPIVVGNAETGALLKYDDIQKKLTAGTNITIDGNNVISAKSDALTQDQFNAMFKVAYETFNLDSTRNKK